MLKNNRKESTKKTKVLKLNLSTTMGVAGAIVFIILAIVAVRMIVTAINSSSQKAMAEEGSQGYTMVASTDVDEEGNVIDVQVPVPDGYTASQVPGETTVNGGFVIYEGEVDWSKIGDLNSYAEIETQAEEAEVNSERSSSTENTNNEVTNTETTGAENNNVASIEAENGIDNADSNVTNNSANITESSEINNTNEEGQIEESANVLEGAEQGTVEGENIEKGEEETQSEETAVDEITENKINDEEERQVNENEEIETNNNEEIEEEQKNNAIINEEEKTDSEKEAEIATMSEEGEEGIKTLAEGETPTTVYELQTSVNQYVWVPVKDVSRIYGIASDGKLWGKLYDYSTTGRSNSNWEETTNGIIRILNTLGHREPDIGHYNTDDDVDIDTKLQSNMDGLEEYEFLAQEIEKNFYETIESIKKYGGFYIGRYETGNLSESKAVVQKMNSDINNQTWYTMYEKCKDLAGDNDNVITSMIWGCLWDETLQWFIESKAKISTGETIDYSKIMDSTDWGNYYGIDFEYTIDGITYNKPAAYGVILPSGTAEYTKANNIYDMAGNMFDWSLESGSAVSKVLRAGYFFYYGDSYAAGNRSIHDSVANKSEYYGCRAILLIK